MLRSGREKTEKNRSTKKEKKMTHPKNIYVKCLKDKKDKYLMDDTDISTYMIHTIAQVLPIKNKVKIIEKKIIFLA